MLIANILILLVSMLIVSALSVVMLITMAPTKFKRATTVDYGEYWPFYLEVGTIKTNL